MLIGRRIAARYTRTRNMSHVYAVWCEDDQSGDPIPSPLGGPLHVYQKRAAFYAQHKKYQADGNSLSHLTKIAAGPTIAEDGVTLIGSHLLIKAASKNDVEQWVHNDPFYTNNVWVAVKIARYLPLAGIKEVPPIQP
jgi:uncharacterized protein YciI